MNPYNTIIMRNIRIFRLIFLFPAGAKSGDFPRIGCGTDLCVSPAGGGRGWILLPFSFLLAPFCPPLAGVARSDGGGFLSFLLAP